MTGWRARMGVALLCVFALSAYAAQGASAKGTTAFTCKKAAGGAGFSDEHCTNAVGSGAKWEHASIAEGKETLIQGIQEGNNILKSGIKGTEVEIICGEETGTGAITNVTDPKGVMQMRVTELKIFYHSCTVVVPLKSTCKVKGGEISTAALKGTSFETEKESGILLEAAKEGGNFAEVVIEGCSLAGSYPVTGTVTVTPSGATWTITEEMSALKLGEEPLKTTSNMTVRMHAEGKTQGDPISMTTTEP